MILYPWKPQTTANTQARIASIKNVTVFDQDVGWRLIVELLPQPYAYSLETNRPKWSKLIADEWDDKVTRQQYAEEISEVCGLAMQLAGGNISRLCDLVPYYFRIAFDQQTVLLGLIRSILDQFQEEEVRMPLWQAIVNLTTSHRRFADDPNWKVPDANLLELEDVAELLHPASPQLRYKYLFDGYWIDDESHELSWPEQQEASKIRRIEALQTIEANGGLDSIVDFAESVTFPALVGATCVNASVQINEIVQLPAILSIESITSKEFVRGYVGEKFAQNGWGWASVLTESLRDQPEHIVGLILAYLPFETKTWAEVERLLGSKESAYWSVVQALPYDEHFDIAAATSKLLKYDRIAFAIQCVSQLIIRKIDVPEHCILDILDAITSSSAVDPHHVTDAIEYLQNGPSIDINRIRKLEWKFISLMGVGSRIEPKSLSAWMSEDPAIFCEVLGYVYRSKKDVASVESSEAQAALALQGYQLFHEWNVVPGSTEDGSIDSKLLKDWVTNVKELTVASGHWDVAMGEIGKVFYHAPVDGVGLPISTISEILDESEHDRMRRGFRIAVFNSRGAFWSDGGLTESQLAEKWKDAAEKAEERCYTYLAGEFRSLSRSYALDAQRESRRQRD